MSLTTENASLSDIAAVVGGNRDNDGLFGGGGLTAILTVVFIIALMGGGFGGFGGFGGGYGGVGAAGAMGGMMYPWMNQMEAMQSGFAQQSTNALLGDLGNNVVNGFSNVNLGLANGFAGVQQSLCNGFAGVNQGVSAGFAQAEIAANGRQMANMQQSFANAQALDARLDSMAMAQQQCCCDQRAGLADVKYTIATENCADRYEAAQNTRDIIESQNRNSQAILDKLCSLELDNYKAQLEAERRANLSLQNQLNMSAARADNAAQTAAILAGQAQRAGEVEQYVNPTARPAYIVQNPNCCPNYTVTPSCGCNGGFVG